MKNKNTSFFQDPRLFLKAIVDSFIKLDPRAQWKNPVMFIVYIGAILTAFDLFSGGKNFSFGVQISAWLWATVFFANFAEALAEGRGKARVAYGFGL